MKIDETVITHEVLLILVFLFGLGIGGSVASFTWQEKYSTCERDIMAFNIKKASDDYK